jgi:hypothetical protein
LRFEPRRATLVLLSVGLCASVQTVLGQVPVDSLDFSLPDTTVTLTADSVRPDTTVTLTADSVRPDTTVTLAADSVRPAIGDTLVPVIHPFSDAPYAVGLVRDSVRPAIDYHLDLGDRLGMYPAGFNYSLGNLGWPQEWSYRGLSGPFVEVNVEGVSVRDPVTNRALLEMLPVDVVDAPSLSTRAHGAPVLLTTKIGAYRERRPYTELRYANGAGGLQFISATHSQRRLWQLLGAPTVAQFIVRFGFHEWTGQYPNSESNLSQVFARIGFTSRRWRIRFTNSYGLRTRGAHSGVIPKPGEGFDSVYDRFDASVGDPGATHRHWRNQFDVSVEHTWLIDLKPLVVRSSYITSLYRYSNQSEVENSSSEFWLRVEQEIPSFISGHELTGRFSIETIDIESTGLLVGGGGSRKSRMIASLDDRFRIGSLDAGATVGMHTVQSWVFPSAAVKISRTFADLVISADASLNGRAPSPLENVGGLEVVASSTSLDHSTTQSIELKAESSGAVLSWSTFGFLTRIVDPIQLVRGSENGDFQVTQIEGSITTLGLAGTLGWRNESTQGFYGIISPTLQQRESSSSDPVSVRLRRSVPSFFGMARFGYRNQYFRGDLDMDLHVIGRFWTAFGGKVYHPVHAVLALPHEGAVEVASSGTLDVRLQAGIREATIFVSVDNILSGWLYPGTLLVPIYPLPSQAFRFGVFWPIWG